MKLGIVKMFNEEICRKGVFEKPKAKPTLAPDCERRIDTKKLAELLTQAIRDNFKQGKR